MSSVDLAALQAWIGRTETRSDVISPVPAAGMSATLDYSSSRASVGEPLPPAWHWLYFLQTPAASDIAVDGHAARGGFLPPVPLQRRMWAGSEIRFDTPLHIGDEVRRESTVVDINHKQGASGELVFVTVEHHIYCGEIHAIEERQNLVYRSADGGQSQAAAKPAPAQAQWSMAVRPDPVMLFRYSALTFNSHRIHYDRDYAMAEEAYAGLVVQGPLTATLLLELLQRELPGAQLQTFRFRGVKPLLEGQSFQVQGRRDGFLVHLWALDRSGALAMDAQVVLREA